MSNRLVQDYTPDAQAKIKEKGVAKVERKPNLDRHGPHRAPPTSAEMARGSEGELPGQKEPKAR